MVAALAMLAGCGGGEDGGELGADGGTPPVSAGSGGALSEEQRVSGGVAWTCTCTGPGFNNFGEPIPGGGDPVERTVCSASAAFALRLVASRDRNLTDCRCCYDAGLVCRREIEDTCEQSAGSVLCADARGKSCPAD